MKIALLSVSFAVVSLAIAASYVLPAGSTLERGEPYKFAMAR
jgi:hypothetical protein